MRSLLLLLAIFAAAVPCLADDTSDLRAARAVFEENLNAIRQRDRAKYLSLYLKTDRLIRTGAAGFATGYDDFARGAGANWPDTIEATDIRLTPVRPGIVYGTYRYRVRYGADERIGISERVFLDTGSGWKIALTGAIETPGIPPSPRAIVGGTLIDGRGGAPVANANVIIRDGKIDCAGTAAQCPVPEGVDVVDAKGKWITPGLVDAHVHFSQTGWADGRPDALDVRLTHPYHQTIADLKANPERYARSYLCSGVTAVFDVGGYPGTLQLDEKFGGDTRMPHVAAAGPLLSTLDHWLNVAGERQFLHLKDEALARAAVAYLAENGAKAIKVWYIVRPPDLTIESTRAAVIAAGDEAKKRNLPLIVHANGLPEAKESLRAGATVLVHSVWEAAVDGEFIDLARKNGTILIPTLTVAGGYVRMFKSAIEKKAPMVDDPNACVDSATLAKLASTATLEVPATLRATFAQREARTAAREKLAAENLKALVAAGIPIATGTDAGNPLTLHGPAIFSEMEAMQAAGMTPMQVIVASTATAARAAGLHSVTGTVEKGKSADLLIVGMDPAANVANFRRIHSVVRGGVVREIHELSAMASGPKPAAN